MHGHPGWDLSDDHPAATLRAQGFALLSPGASARLAGVDAAAIARLAPHWEALPPDTHLRDGGQYRFRRHASLRLSADGARIEAAVDRPHWQPTEYNALHGGYLRRFAPVTEAALAAPAFVGHPRDHAVAAGRQRRPPRHAGADLPARGLPDLIGRGDAKPASTLRICTRRADLRARCSCIAAAQRRLQLRIRMTLIPALDLFQTRLHRVGSARLRQRVHQLIERCVLSAQTLALRQHRTDACRLGVRLAQLAVGDGLRRACPQLQHSGRARAVGRGGRIHGRTETAAAAVVATHGALLRGRAAGAAGGRAEGQQDQGVSKAHAGTSAGRDRYGCGVLAALKALIKYRGRDGG
ncbi:MAG: 2OG-Fe dioxygenase family protein [Lysobacterales bacterium]